MKKMRDILNESLGESLTSGQFVRGLRIERGLSQEELMEITGIARPNISALENERMEMTAHYALLLAAALLVHPQEILFPNGFFHRTQEYKNIQKRALMKIKKTSS